MAPGMSVLIRGVPAVGKSTLLLELARGDGRSRQCRQSLYVPMLESADQVGSRALRMGGLSGMRVSERAPDLARVVSCVANSDAKIVLLDDLEVTGRGTVSERACFDSFSRSVSERGAVAVVALSARSSDFGWLDHVVDVILDLQKIGSTSSGRGAWVQISCSSKNRFGRVGETAEFEMRGDGLAPIGVLASSLP